jgi:hypothetical protein
LDIDNDINKINQRVRDVWLKNLIRGFQNIVTTEERDKPGSMKSDRMMDGLCTQRGEPAYQVDDKIEKSNGWMDDWVIQKIDNTIKNTRIKRIRANGIQ